MNTRIGNAKAVLLYPQSLVCVKKNLLAFQRLSTGYYACFELCLA